MENVLQSLMKKRGLYHLSGSKANKLTRECLQTALTYLMSEKPFEAISITELVKRSGVSRQSFYRNYRSKEDILKDICKSIGENITAAMFDSKYIASTYQWYYDLFKFINDNQEKLCLIIQAKVQQEIREALVPVLHEIFCTESDEEYYQLIAYEGGLNAMVGEWFASGMKKDIAEMAKLCDSFYGNFHRRLLVRSGRKEDNIL